MQTYFIHINGLVQGVGFRPHVFKCAQKFNINGWVCNDTDGVHIEINASKEIAEKFNASQDGGMWLVSIGLIKHCKIAGEYDKILKPLADQQIVFDLDDGVMVNYAKFNRP